MITKSKIIKERDYWKEEAEYYKERYESTLIDSRKWIEHYGVLMRLESDGIISNDLHKIIHKAFYEKDEQVESFLTREFKKLEL